MEKFKDCFLVPVDDHQVGLYRATGAIAAPGGSVSPALAPANCVMFFERSHTPAWLTSSSGAAEFGFGAGVGHE